MQQCLISTQYPSRVTSIISSHTTFISLDIVGQTHTQHSKHTHNIANNITGTFAHISLLMTGQEVFWPIGSLDRLRGNIGASHVLTSQNNFRSLSIHTQTHRHTRTHIYAHTPFHEAAVLAWAKCWGIHERIMSYWSLGSTQPVIYNIQEDSTNRLKLITVCPSTLPQCLPPQCLFLFCLDRIQHDHWLF